MGNTPLGYLWGWSAPIQVTLCPIDSCYSLNRGIRHLERSFHLSSTQGGLSPPLTTLGDYQPLERIITSHYPGGLSPPREFSFPGCEDLAYKTSCTEPESYPQRKRQFIVTTFNSMQWSIQAALIPRRPFWLRVSGVGQWAKNYSLPWGGGGSPISPIVSD